MQTEEKKAATIKIIECPRDAMQGWSRHIPTEEKVAYLNALLRVGFDTLDFGSFVSPKAIPQMADTSEVLRQLQIPTAGTKLLAIVANLRGAEEAVKHAGIHYLGYPFSISETFQLRNTNKTIAASLDLVRQMQTLSIQFKKELVVYISMGFGNPYGDPYNKEVVMRWVNELTAMGIRILSLADTVGVAHPDNIAYLFSHLIPAFPEVEFGAHFHSTPQTRQEKIAAAYDNGCRRFDVAINGIGGCPMAKDELVGNMATEDLLHFMDVRGIPISINLNALSKAQTLATQVFQAGG